MAPPFPFHILNSMLDHQSHDKYKSEKQDGLDKPHYHHAIPLMKHVLLFTMHLATC